MVEETKIAATADRIVELGKELETAGHVALDAPTVVRARQVLHDWVDGMQGIVVNPALGRVTVIDKNGNASSIASADLAYTLSAAGITRAL